MAGDDRRAPRPAGRRALPADGRDHAAQRGPAATASAPAEPPVLLDQPPRRALQARAGRRWLASDLHTHTVHSDGVLTVAGLAALAAGRGLDFIAVTDHNTISHHAELAAAARRYGIALCPARG